MEQALLLLREQEQGIETAIRSLVDVVLEQAPQAEVLALLGLLATSVGRLAQQQSYAVGPCPPPEAMNQSLAQRGIGGIS